MEEPTPVARPCSTPHSAPIGWLRDQPSAATAALPDADALRAAIELVVAHPDAVAEVLTRARPRPARHDGWTGERMAAFLETLAETGLVTEACRAAGMSREAARQLRNRDPVFDAAMAAAASRARSVVADGLLERSITGTVEHYYRDGVLVGERRHYESWLGLAVLRRLDKQAQQDREDATLAARISGGWQAALDALRSGGSAAVPLALPAEVGKVGTPHPSRSDAAENCWQNDEGTWMTHYPPPAGFDGYQNREWDLFHDYERVCTEEEVAVIEAAADAEEYLDRAREEAHRDAWLADLRNFAARSAVGPGAQFA